MNKMMKKKEMVQMGKTMGHGHYGDSRTIATAGAVIAGAITHMKPDNPMTPSGHSVMSSMKRQYGEKKAKQVFYASINAKKPGSSKWHRKK